MITFKYERPDAHKPFSMVKTVVFELDTEDASLDELLDAYREFLQGIGYNISGELEVVDYDDEVLFDDVQESIRQQDAPRTVFSDMGKIRDILP